MAGRQVRDNCELCREAVVAEEASVSVELRWRSVHTWALVNERPTPLRAAGPFQASWSQEEAPYELPWWAAGSSSQARANKTVRLSYEREIEE